MAVLSKFASDNLPDLPLLANCLINCDQEDLILERAFYESLCFLPALRNLTLYDVYLGPKQELTVFSTLIRSTLPKLRYLTAHLELRLLLKDEELEKLLTLEQPFAFFRCFI
ncbi:hypothetical protein TYRP_012177 [Tyrophagus putrescentiae]|nr:hypothetical protein TYRP_012177 [Tyrophagus putrescentiae]